MGRDDFLTKAGLRQAASHDENAGVPIDNAKGSTQESDRDICPRCGADVAWSGLPARRSLLAPLLRYGYYRRCPQCGKETEVAL